MRLTSLAATLLINACASAQDAQLEALHATLVTLHAHAAEASLETRGARPELTIAKHQLRHWIETQLGSLKDLQGVKAFSDRINQALKPVGVADSESSDGFWSLLGDLGEVRVDGESGMLTVITGVGILCGSDESGYGYKFNNGRWQRIWESEQNDYSPKKYAPQHIAAVHVSQPFRNGRADSPPFVLTLGSQDWCTSSWHSVYYRVWRIDPTGSKLLIEATESAYLRAEPSIVGSIAQSRIDPTAPVDILIEFTERSVDGGVHNREAVRHFLIDGDQVRRADPVALSPRDFVDEWLTHAWKESIAWTAASALQQWYRKLHSGFVSGGFDYPTKHCQTPDLYQVMFGPNYFLVRWRPPYHFTMMDIRDEPWPLCTQEDREADEWRTLFPTQEWRQ